MNSNYPLAEIENKKKRSRVGWIDSILLAIFLFFPTSVLADVKPYGGEKTFEIKSENLVVTHFHDWHAQPRIGYLTIQRNGEASAKKFPAPALTYLWVSSDEAYIVGLSHIKDNNDTQLIVWNNSGDIIFKRPVSCKQNDLNIKNCGETSAVLVLWYDEDNPAIELLAKDDSLLLSIRETKRGECYFVIKTQEERENPEWYKSLNCDEIPPMIAIKIPLKKRK